MENIPSNTFLLIDGACIDHTSIILCSVCKAVFKPGIAFQHFIRSQEHGPDVQITGD